MEAILLRRLESLAARVREGIVACFELPERFESGEECTSEHTKQIEKLRLAVDRLVKELQNVLNGRRDEVSENFASKIATFTEMQLEAEEILTEIDAHKLVNNTAGSYNTSHLPDLAIPHFDGDPLKFTEFWDQFSSAVNNKGLTEVEKLNYLISVLEGSAKETVRGLRMTHQNYTLAVQKLTERFGKPEMIIDKHYSELYRLEPASSNDTIVCRKVLDQVEGHLKTLELMGRDVNKNEGLRTIIMEKFPAELNYEIRKSLKGAAYSVQNIREKLQKAISDRETSIASSKCPGPNGDEGHSFTTETLFSSSSAEQKGKHQGDGRGDSRNLPHGSKQPSSDSRGGKSTQNKRPHQLRTGSTPNRGHFFPTRRGPGNLGPPTKKRKVECVYCKGTHYGDMCEKFKTIAERKKLLKGRCYQCFQYNHFTAQCVYNRKCVYCGASGLHNRSLCPTKFQQGSRPKDNKTDVSTSMITFDSHYETLLPTAMTTVNNGESIQTKNTRVLFDTGSQRTYVTTDLAKELKLKVIDKSELTIYTFGCMAPTRIKTALVTLRFYLNTDSHIDIFAHTVPRITGPIPANAALKQSVREQYPDHEIAPDAQNDCPVSILIGSDFYHSFITGTTKPIQENLYLMGSHLGWILSGQHRNKFPEQMLSFVTYVQGNRGIKEFAAPDQPFQYDSVKGLWELEAIGINDPPKVLQQDEIIDYFNKTTTVEDGRYQVKWPWVQYPTDLPRNYGLAVGRLNSLIRRLDRDTLYQYDQVIQDQLSKGVIEVIDVSQSSVAHPPHPVHYLPHHCVVQEGKTTKVRIVYDASARVKGGCSLNDYLFKGPRMLEDLVALLLRFRMHPVALTADIEKAFLQVGLQMEDRDVTRFLWLKDINQGVDPDNLVHLRFCRVPFGIVSSPYLLAATIKHHLARQESTEAELISNSLYVDNLICSVTSEEEAMRVYYTARKSFADLSMNLREWTSNSKEFKGTIPSEQQNTQTKVSVLGLKWNTDDDLLSLAFKVPITKQVSSKRHTLETVASVFDPCGYVAPFTLPARLLIQELWQDKYKWDDQLNQSRLDDWAACVNSLNKIGMFSMKRAYNPLLDRDGVENTQDVIQLHCFTDASQNAYAAVVYLRFTVPEVSTAFVMSRSRLTPLRQRDQMTIPKLELLGVLIGVRLILYIQRTLQLLNVPILLWTDSQVVLSWVRSDLLLPPFVARRISEIKAASHVHFRYVNSDLNPADVATRPINIDQLNLPSLWTEGPGFLLFPPDQWPVDTHINDGHDNQGYEGNSLPLAATNPQKGSSNTDLPQRTACFPTSNEPQPTSSPDQLPAATSTNNTSRVTASGCNYSIEEIKQVQREYFPLEVNGTATSLTKTLHLFVDKSGLLRCEGKLQNADLPFDQKFPILLPRESPFTAKVIQQIHCDHYHVGVSHSLALVRKRFWIPKGRAQVGKIIKRCQRCVKYGGGPFKLPDMPPLPKERVTACPPFSYTGLDYLGPLTVGQEGGSQKRWCVLFTCMAIRAIHLELVQDMTTDEFMQAFRRFVAARGAPVVVVSDNALQFKLTANVINSSFCKAKNIQWRFIPELSPWQGGFYERLVGLVKHCLRRSLDKILLTDTQLQTVIKEVEAVLNTRPLTAVGPDLEHVLTPADFLHPVAPVVLDTPEPSLAGKMTVTRTRLIDTWKRSRSAFDEFQSMFRDHYLTRLQERMNRSHQQPRVVVTRAPKIGEVVQVKDDAHGRVHWLVGRVATLLPSHDGNTRTARVQLLDGRFLTRSISHLYPLELADESDDEVGRAQAEDPPSQSPVQVPQDPSHALPDGPPALPPTPSLNPLSPPDNTPSVPAGHIRPPRRQAAEVARARLRQQLTSCLLERSASCQQSVAV